MKGRGAPLVHEPVEGTNSHSASDLQPVALAPLAGVLRISVQRRSAQTHLPGGGALFSQSVGDEGPAMHAVALHGSSNVQSALVVQYSGCFGGGGFGDGLGAATTCASTGSLVATTSAGREHAASSQNERSPDRRPELRDNT